MNRSMKDILKNKKATSGISFGLGFAFLYFSTLFQDQGFGKQICESLAQVFFIAIPVTFITSYLSDCSTENLIKNFLPICNKCQQYGLIDILDCFPMEDKEFRNEFVVSKEFILVMNDGKQFFSNNSELIDKRLKNEREINVILLDYNNSMLMEILTKKNGHEGNYYKDKIADVIKYHLSNDRIHVHLNSFYNTMAILVTDNYAIISLYREALGKGKVPHFVFKNNGSDGEYAKILRDVKELYNNRSNGLDEKL